MLKKEKITLVIPAKNEYENLIVLIPKIPKEIDEVLLVLGGNDDGTLEALKKYKKVKILNQTRKGKGAALILGLENAKNRIIICMDADGSMRTQELRMIVENMIKFNSQLIKGSRYLPGGGSEDLTLLRSFGNKLFLHLVNLVYRRNFTDLAYGYFGIRKTAFNELNVSGRNIFGYGTGFEIETLLICRATELNMKIDEFPSLELKRLNGKSNLKIFRVGTRILITIIIERFHRFSKKFKANFF
jgi:glycosyltransferase involved in cell wall biosynthesis